MGSMDNSGSGALDARATPDPGQSAAEKPASFRREVSTRPSSRRAVLASLQAQLHTAREAGDIESERALATKLARALVQAGTQLDTATRLARRSLLLGDDLKLREELSAWFAGLGRLNLASGTLEPLLERQLSGADRARLWVRIAVLRARAGEAEASAEALRDAALADPNDPLPLELLAAIRAFAPHAVSSLQAAQSLLAAADLRDARGDERAALEDLLQALTFRPEHPEAVERMVRHLVSIGRAQAADEVWRRCALALPPRDARSLSIHERRVREALDAQLPAVAFGRCARRRGRSRIGCGTHFRMRSNWSTTVLASFRCRISTACFTAWANGVAARSCASGCNRPGRSRRIDASVCPGVVWPTRYCRARTGFVV